MNKFLPIVDEPNLIRDASTGGVLNVNGTAYAAHKKSKMAAAKKMEIEQAKEERINNLENDVKELKAGVSQILEILKNGNR